MKDNFFLIQNHNKPATANSALVRYKGLSQKNCRYTIFNSPIIVLYLTSTEGRFSQIKLLKFTKKFKQKLMCLLVHS